MVGMDPEKELATPSLRGRTNGWCRVMITLDLTTEADLEDK